MNIIYWRPYRVKLYLDCEFCKGVKYKPDLKYLIGIQTELIFVELDPIGDLSIKSSSVIRFLDPTRIIFSGDLAWIDYPGDLTWTVYLRVLARIYLFIEIRTFSLTPTYAGYLFWRLDRLGHELRLGAWRDQPLTFLTLACASVIRVKLTYKRPNTLCV